MVPDGEDHAQNFCLQKELVYGVGAGFVYARNLCSANDILSSMEAYLVVSRRKTLRDREGMQPGMGNRKVGYGTHDQR